MWIRSQDKKVLINVGCVSINYSKPGEILGWISPFDTSDYSASFTLGDYNTDSRAIEVLDEIQKHLVIGAKYDTLHDGRRDMHEKVFNMPQE